MILDLRLSLLPTHNIQGLCDRATVKANHFLNDSVPEHDAQ
jgi:hypothetical protein